MTGLWPDTWEEFETMAAEKLQSMEKIRDTYFVGYVIQYRDFNNWMELSVKRMIRKKYDTLRSTV